MRVLRYGNKAARIHDWKAWLARIAWRVAVERRGKLTQSSARHEQTTDDLPGPAAAPIAVLLEKERTGALQRMIAGLPRQLRDALVLATVEELSPREVADVLGISEAAVRSRAFRARQILRERLTMPGDRK